MPVSMIQPLNRLVDIDGEASKVVLWSSLRGERNTGWQVVADIPFEQIKEITGCDDVNRIRKAWNNCSRKGNNQEATIAEVISALCQTPKVKDINYDVTSHFNENHYLDQQGTDGQNRQRSNSMETQTDTSKQIVDLTSDGDNDDIQKAIAASLEAAPGVQPAMLGGQITREDQDISRVLEASLADSKVDNKKNPVWYIDHANPYERRRENSWPVGLKNVGNTCWFNAVIQSLFHIETFRELVLNYEPSEELNKENQIAVFMVELKRLFALMLASDRKYLNPSTAIEVLKHSFSSGEAGQTAHSSNGQQDVSEFQHKLLDWLEEAFQHRAHHAVQNETPEAEMMSQQSQSQDSTSRDEDTPMDVDPPPKEKDDNNSMVKLFYGKVRTYGTNAGETFTTHTHFGQWPLYVAGFSDIHQSLEAGLAQGDIETNNTDQTSNQEQWFSHLPPLLTFELSRFSYNTMQSQAEKLHNKFSFPQTLYLDRYVEQNKDEVRAKRDKLTRLRMELSKLETDLHKYTHYGRGDRQFPLSDILDYSLQFAMSNNSIPQPCALSQSSPQSMAHSSSSNPKFPSTSAAEPRPLHVSEEEMQVLTTCLNRWKQEVMSSIEEYEKCICGLKDDVSKTYEQEHLKLHKYCLHAVMVHEGEAVSGHYWSYVYNREANTWLKFNDISVTEASWQEVVKESEGGYGTASAYCLIYTQSTDNQEKPREGAVLLTGHDFPSKEEALGRLPDDLQAYVLDDNQKLQDEIQQWDASKALIAAEGEHDGAGAKSSLGAPDILSSVNPDIASSQSRGFTAVHCIKSEVDEYAHEHAQSLLSLVRNKYGDISKSQDYPTPQNKFEQLVTQCYERYLQASKDLSERLPVSDTRTHIAIYLLVVYGQVINPSDVKMIIADQVARLNNTHDLSGWSSVQREAAKMTSNYYEGSADFQNNYIKWHREHHGFRIVLSQFVEGIQLFNQSKYEEALPYLHDAHMKNTIIIQSGQITDRSSPLMRGVDIHLLASIRNQCIERFNEMALAQFETEDDFLTPLKVMLHKVLPVLDSMKGDNTDNNFVGSVKEKWVNLALTETMDAARAEAISDFIGQVFEPATSQSSDLNMGDILKVPLDIGAKYKTAIQRYHERIADSQFS